MSEQAIHCEPIALGSVQNTVFHHVAGDFLLGEGEKLVKAQANDLGPGFVSAMFDDGLHNIVAPLVCGEFFGNFVELLEDERLVGRCSLFDHPLDHSARVRLLRELGHPAPNGVVDEVDTLPRQLGQNLLDDVVAVVAVHDAEEVRLELAGELDLLLDKNVLERL